MKGQVACKMSVSELLITELIYENKLNILSAAEAAALLSVFAFQGKKREREPEENYEEVLPHTLLKVFSFFNISILLLSNCFFINFLFRR